MAAVEQLLVLKLVRLTTQRLPWIRPRWPATPHLWKVPTHRPKVKAMLLLRAKVTLLRQKAMLLHLPKVKAMHLPKPKLPHLPKVKAMLLRQKATRLSNSQTC